MGEIANSFNVNLFGHSIHLSLSLIVQWIIVIIVSGLSIGFSRNIKKMPDKKQSVIELFVETITKLVEENMGENAKAFVPFIGTIVIYLLAMNLVGIFGIKPPTTDYSVALGMAIITFVVCQGYAIKKVGLLHYFIGYAKPLPILLPINIMERIMLPVSLSLRLFGNMFAATIIMELVYSSLGKIAWIAQVGIPVPLHLYFDLFDGTIQMVIFMMLTMINIKIIAEH